MEVEQTQPSVDGIPPPAEPENQIPVGRDGLPNFVDNDVEDHHQTEGSSQVAADGQPLEHFEKTDEHEEDGDANVKYVGTCGTIFNILNSLMGSGILSVPNTFVNIGIFPSFVLMAVTAFLAWLSGVLVLELLKQTHAVSFDHLAAIILGNLGSRILSVLNLLFLICCLLGFLIIASDMIISWFALGGIDITKGERMIIVLVYSICIPIALALPRKIGFLSYFSVASVFCIFFFCICVTYKGIEHIVKNGVNPTISYGHMSMGLFSSISIYGLSFALSLVFIPAISLYRTDLKARRWTTFYAMLLCLLLVGVPGLFGYLQFGKDTEGNVLKSYDANDILMVVVKSGFFFVVSCAYPMVSQTVMSTWSFIIFKDTKQAGLPFLKRAVVQLITHAIPLVIAIFLAEVKPALSVGGSLGGCIAQFTFPPWMWIKNSDKPLSHWTNVLCIIFAIFGVVVGIISTYQAIVDAIDAFKK